MSAGIQHPTRKAELIKKQHIAGGRPHSAKIELSAHQGIIHNFLPPANYPWTKTNNRPGPGPIYTISTRGEVHLTSEIMYVLISVKQQCKIANIEVGLSIHLHIVCAQHLHTQTLDAMIGSLRIPLVSYLVLNPKITS